jgi:hypothetical protein
MQRLSGGKGTDSAGLAVVKLRWSSFRTCDRFRPLTAKVRAMSLSVRRSRQNTELLYQTAESLTLEGLNEAASLAHHVLEAERHQQMHRIILQPP